MSERKLHIVCFTIPFPVDYGGVFDLYYKLEALKNIGLEVHLHCIQYGNNVPQVQLEHVCQKVYYYKRATIFPLKFWGLPYIVESRVIPALVDRLNQDDAPILLEAIHSTGVVTYLKPAKRTVLVRLHNVEHIYYGSLAATSTSLLKKIYYTSEAYRLRKWEKRLVKQQTHYSAVALLDQYIYQNLFHCRHISYLPLFIPPWEIKKMAGRGDYCLYQGNLDIEENQKAVKWIVEKIFSGMPVPLYVAGKSSGSFVRNMRRQHPDIHWVENPTDPVMDGLILNAQIHLLPSFNATGIKVKLLNALYNGRFCLVNGATVKDSGLDSLCIVAHGIEDFKEKTHDYFSRPFSEKDRQARIRLLSSLYDNNKNAILLRQQLFGE